MTAGELLPTVTVVVPTHRRSDRITRCLDAILADPAATEVVVVVDGRFDDSLDLLERWAKDQPRLRPVEVPHGGLYRALQAGVEHARSEIVLMIDDDLVAQHDLVAGHARRHARHTARQVVLGYMPTIAPEPRRAGDFATHLYASAYEWTCRAWEDDEPSLLSRFWGGNFSLRRDEALEVGMAPAAEPLPYHDDQEFGLRLRRAGFHAVFDRSLLAHHEHRRGLADFAAEAERRALGQLMIQRLHGDLVDPLSTARYYETLGAPVRWVVQVGRFRLAAKILLPLLRLAIRLGGAVRWWRLENAAAIALLHIIELRTVIEHGGDVLPAPRP